MCEHRPEKGVLEEELAMKNLPVCPGEPPNIKDRRIVRTSCVAPRSHVLLVGYTRLKGDLSVGPGRDRGAGIRELEMPQLFLAAIISS